MDKMDIVKALLLDTTVENKTTDTEYLFEVGDVVFLRTVTLYYLGRIKKIQGGFVELEDACWVQDTGSRLAEFLTDGVATSTELEPTGRTLVNITNVIDCLEWKHKLPTKAQ